MHTNATVPAIAFLLVLAVSRSLGLAAEARTYYVSPAGNDAWSRTLPAPDGGGERRPLRYAGARDALRALKAEAPLALVFLHSRAGEDWYQLKCRYSEAPLPPGEENLGLAMQKYVGDLLIRECFPFRFAYLYHADDVRQAANEATVLLAPFAHSISDEAAEVLADAVRAGRKLVLIRFRGENVSVLILTLLA